MTSPLRIGYVPEHFSVPLHLAFRQSPTPTWDLIPFPAGTGHMITALRANELDLAIGLTEAWIAGLAKDMPPESLDGGYRLVGTYVESHLCV